jgi:hypothetical protein
MAAFSINITLGVPGRRADKSLGFVETADIFLPKIRLRVKMCTLYMAASWPL